MSREALVHAIHAAPPAGVVAVAGGGSQLVTDLLTVPGASATVLEAIVPYAPNALGEFIGALPEQAVSVTTACDMAMAAFERARHLAPTRNDCFGLAVTASLRTLAAKRGEHRAHVAMQTATTTWCKSLVFDKESRSRSDEERLAADIALVGLAQALGLDAELPLPLHGNEHIETRSQQATSDWQSVLTGLAPYVAMGPPVDAVRIVMPGAFNPLHAAHRAMAAHAAKIVGADVVFELCIRNVDKPALNYLAIAERIAQFEPSESILLTRLPTFVEKARQFPGVTFVLGVDTLLRIADVKYYGSAKARNGALDELAEHGCRMLVFGRIIQDQFVGFEKLELPASLAAICTGVDEAEFRHDISSTALRSHRK